MLGSLSEAEDAVQEAWLRLSRSGTGEIRDLGGWLTTVVARVCLDMLRTRRARREDPLDVHLPDPIVSPVTVADGDPEAHAVLADTIGLGARADSRRHRQIVDAFLAAAREGDIEALVTMLDPQVVLRADAGTGPMGPSRLVRGAPAVARQVLRYASLARFARPVLVNGSPGLLGVRDGRAFSLVSMTIRGDTIIEIDVLADPQRLSRLDLAGLDDR